MSVDLGSGVPAAGALERLSAFDPLEGNGDGDGGAPRRLGYVLVDVFTGTPLEGNQLGVVTDARGLDGDEMQAIAREMKLSETVFALPAEQSGDIRLRIFTPAAELPFAGHPVLGSGILLAIALEREEVEIETGAGRVPVRVLRDGRRRGSGWMLQPLPSWRDYEHVDELLAASGLAASGLPVELYDNGPRHVLVAVGDTDALAALRPDLGALADLDEACFSFFAGEGSRWTTRVFCPSLGVPEDPATGSAAGPLAVHLARHGRISFGDEVEISQGVQISRPSLLRAVAHGSTEQLERVEVGGEAVVLATGALCL